jgi:hypothetical protein
VDGVNSDSLALEVDVVIDLEVFETLSFYFEFE